MNIVLDYDGTIHDTLNLYASAFRKTYKYLVSKGLAPLRDFTDREIGSWLGYSPKEMWDCFMPELSESEKNTCIKMIGDEMSRLMSLGFDKLYDDALETLADLKAKGHTLLFLSNCSHRYMEDHRKTFNLDKYYDGFYCTEDFGYKEKPEIFNTIKIDFPGKYLIVGDRFKDIEIGDLYNLPTVGCLYGFGTEEELASATYKINKPCQLVEVVTKL